MFQHLSKGAVGSAKNLLRPVKRRLFGPAPRARNDYSTHLPVLVGLARTHSIESVLELGTGRYSTQTFLNRKAFPELQLLHSYETDKRWADIVKSSINNDARATINFVEGPMAKSVSGVDLNAYDLVLVDDSTTIEARANTIRAVGSFHPSRPLVLIHDFEIRKYVEASDAFANRYTFRAFNPETGIVWSTSIHNRRSFIWIDKTIRRHARRLEPDDLEGWIGAFARR